MSGESQVSLVLQRINRGDGRAVGELFPLVYGELRKRAQFLMNSERSDHTLQPTALVHEAFVKMVSGQTTTFQSRLHFYNAASEAMRRILVDHARSKKAGKRGGGLARVALEDVDPAQPEPAVDYEALDVALRRLSELDDRRYRVVMYRYFSGLSEKMIAELLQVTEKTVQRDWKIARHFLAAEINRGENPSISGLDAQ